METMESIRERFEEMGEYYAAGYFEQPDAVPFVRFSRGLRRYLETYPLPAYRGESLYPCGPFGSRMCIKHNYSRTADIDYRALEQKAPDLVPLIKEQMPEFRDPLPRKYRVGGTIFCHSIPNYRRLVREGLDSYEERVKGMKDADLRAGLLDVLAGIRQFHGRTLEMLAQIPEAEKLYHALQKVPFRPAESLYEALVCWNFIFYMDGCDNVGRMDVDLMDFYRGEDVTDILHRFFKNADANNSWSGALGPEYNPLTIQCLRAIKGVRRPSLELRVEPDMPREVWEAAIDAVCAGGGSPSFYNEPAYQQTLGEYFPEIPKEDLLRFSGGGCTESMLAGISNVGSLDAGINIASIFEGVMRRELPRAESFEAFYDLVIRECTREIETALNAISTCQELRSRVRPHPMRTLLIDDCIQKERDFNDQGARYRWSVVNLAGMINVIDSLLVIQKLVYTDGVMDGAQLLAKLDEGETFLTWPEIPRHGNDDARANAMAARFSTDLCAVFEGKIPYSGGKFLPSSIQFTTYLNAGKIVGPTPDGRTDGAPLCDSIGAVHGNDRNGVTALLNSAAALCQKTMAGTPVLNIRLDANQAAKTLMPLVKSYFESGGMQLQVTCVNRDDLLDAQKHPEKYPNLIVRIGGYSEYFRRLPPELQQTVIDRTVHCM